MGMEIKHDQRLLKKFQSTLLLFWTKKIYFRVLKMNNSHFYKL